MGRKPYIRTTPKLWWLSQRRYTVYMVRELTSAFIGAYAVVILIGLFRLSQGPLAYAAYLDMLYGAPAIVFHIAAFAFAVLHTVTWFGLTPKAMPLRLGAYAVPGVAIITVHYVAWFVISAGLLLAAGA